MQYLPAREGVNTLFGKINIEANTGLITIPNDNGNDAKYESSIQDYIMRGKDGIQKKMLYSNKTVEALTAPAAYIEAVVDNLKTTVTKIEDDFERIYKNEISRGLSLEQTKKNTVEEVDRLLSKYLRYHEEKYPMELIKRVIKKLTG